jgi:hypothetical protein
MQVHSREAEGGWNESGRGFAIGAKSFAVHKQLGIEMTGAPAVQNPTYRGFIRAKKFSYRLQSRRKRYDRTHIQITVGPTVQAVADAGSEGIVDSRVAERALNANGLKVPLAVEKSRKANNGV